MESYELHQLSNFSIPFASLSPGFHEYQFKVDREFWLVFDKAPLKESDIEVLLKLEKKPRLLELSFDLKGTYRADCDRCLANTTFGIEVSHHFFVKLTTALPQKDEDPDVLFLSPEETILNVAELVYETILMGVPIRFIKEECEEGTVDCDHKVLDILDAGGTEIEEEEKGSETETGVVDPRWSALLDLKKDLPKGDSDIEK